MNRHLKTFLIDFMKCGLTGWCMEIIFTALGSLRDRDMTLKGVTSLWMFPIYGCAAVVAPLSRLFNLRFISRPTPIMITMTAERNAIILFLSLSFLIIEIDSFNIPVKLLKNYFVTNGLIFLAA